MRKNYINGRVLPLTPASADQGPTSKPEGRIDECTV
jgi:hypothetical protein